MNVSKISKNFEREMEKILEIILKLTDEIQQVKDLQSFGFETKIDLDNEIEKYKINLIKIALKITQGDQLRAARLLKVKKTTFKAKVKKYNICLNTLEF